MAHSRSSDGTVNDGRALLSMLNSAATDSNWLGSALFIGFVGALFQSEFYAIVFFAGWAGSWLLATTVIVPRVRRFGRYTIPDFLGARYDNGATRLIGIGVLLTVLWTFLTAQLYGVGIVIAHQLDVAFSVAVFVGLAVALVCLPLIGWQRAIWLPTVVTVIAIIAYVATALVLPSTTNLYLLTPLSDDVATQAAFAFDRINPGALLFCLAVGMAALPQIDMQRLTTATTRSALGGAWGLLFAVPIALFAERYISATAHLIDRDAMVVKAPAIAGTSTVFTVLIAVGALAVLLSMAARLLRAILVLLRGDSLPARGMSTSKAAAFVAITASILIGIAAAYVAGTRPASILTMMAWGVSLAASGLFAPIVLGLWWKRTTTIGAGCGIAAGFALCLFYIAGTQFFPDRFVAMFGSDPMMPTGAGWWGIDNAAAGLFGIPVALAVTILVSLVTPAPSPEMQEFVASLHRRREVRDPAPRGSE